MNFSERVEQVFPDWSYGHPKALYGLIRAMQPEFVVEVGTYLGYGAAWMAQALRENGKGRLFCIDNWSLNDRASQQGNPRTAFERNLSDLGLLDLVTIIEGNSHEVEWPERIDFAYIDGWHGYLSVQHDFFKCSASGAECICLDDTIQSIGPRLLMEATRQDNTWDVIDIQRDCGLSVCVRRKPKGPITFSQEIPGHPGVDLTKLSPQEQAEHFILISQLNKVNYDFIRNNIYQKGTE